MTTQTTQETNTTSIEPTWTDVARAVFRTGKRQMSMDDFIVTFLRLFRELQGRCPDTGFTTRRLMDSIKELQDGGFLDGANIASCRGGCLAAADECRGHRNKPDPFVELALRDGR